MIYHDTIVALATPSGAGAIAVIRISGNNAITIASEVFQSVSGKDITKQKSHTLHLGHITDGTKVLDQVLLSIFKGTNSYTAKILSKFLAMVLLISNNKLYNYCCAKAAVWHKLESLRCALF